LRRILFVVATEREEVMMGVVTVAGSQASPLADLNGLTLGVVEPSAVTGDRMSQASAFAFRAMVSRTSRLATRRWRLPARCRSRKPG
jgi:hypothetical protein